MAVDYKACIECGKCTKSCVFLDKYNINLKDYGELEDLAYNCYLCGECKRVCPVDIDGRKLSLELREERLENGYNLYRNGYMPLLIEKRNYIFKNYKNVKSKIAFFPGCNFPAYYPDTTKTIIDILDREFSISTIFDCCGKPIADLAMRGEEDAIKNRLNSRFEKLGIEELILVCPNCYYYLKDELDIRVSMIYEHENIMESLISNETSIEGELFLPCPDKDQRYIYNMLDKYVDYSKLRVIDDIQCCGAGGCASIKEKELTKKLQDNFKNYNENIYVYCATCSGMISKSNGKVEHILVKLLGTKEEVSSGFSSFKNRAVFSLKK